MKTKELKVVACANRNDRNWNSNNENLDRSNDNGRMAQPASVIKNMKLYEKIYDFDNLFFAYQKARKGKTRRAYVIEFEKDLERKLLDLQFELKSQTYKPLPMETFILRDPKTRVISKADFRDRIIHHALINIIGPIFEKSFIYDSCANRKGKGTLFAIRRFDKFMRKVSKNNTAPCFVLKADIKHYFQEINHEILLELIKNKIKDEKASWLTKQIVKANFEAQRERVTIASEASRLVQTSLSEFTQSKKGLPLGNLTSQYFANIYLNKFDNYLKRRLKVKNYIRYVDDFIIFHNSKKQLLSWKTKIETFLKEKLKLELHPDKSFIICLSRGVDFVGFRNFYFCKRLRKRNIKKIFAKIDVFHKGELTKEKLLEIFQGWQAYAKWANTFKLRKSVIKQIYKNPRQQSLKTSFCIK